MIELLYFFLFSIGFSTNFDDDLSYLESFFFIMSLLNLPLKKILLFNYIKLID
jgi:hypothetical protein